MKKAVLGLVVVIAACAGIAVAADPETVWREKLRSVVSTNGPVVARSASVVTEPTTNTPAFTGQFLFGGAGEGTNGVWVAKGLTTNDWVKVAP